ncbi:MAG: AAA family ATPase [Streptosporangiaceae bacterium]
MGPEETAVSCSAILDELERAVVGRRRTLELVLTGILAGGHVLLEDLPGLGKTLIARSFARVPGLDFARIQFTPDLLPSDVVGAPLYDQRSADMVFRPGPVFTQLLLADEINRTPPKTQAALLEAMGEGQVSVDGQTRRLPQPFIVLATDNPIEYEGTYELPEAQLDRFLMRLRLGYLTTGDEPTCSGGEWPGPPSTWTSTRSPARTGCWPCGTRLSRWRSPPTCSTTSWPSSRRPGTTRRSRSARARAAAWR